MGDRWSALILHVLHDGPIRFCDLERRLGIGTRTLTKRLEILMDYSVIEQIPVKGTRYFSYTITEKGRSLDTVIHAMIEWPKTSFQND